MKNYKIGHLFRDVHHHHISCLDFADKTSEPHLLVACSEDGIVGLYDCLKPALIKSYAMSECPHVVRFTHSPSHVLMAMSKSAILSYVNLNGNTTIHSFSGISEVVHDISMSPASDVFLTTSDTAATMWDVRQPQQVAKVTSGLGGGIARLQNPRVVFDPLGQIFALSSHDRQLRFYDARNYGQGPFSSYEVVESYRPDVAWQSLQFSPDGGELMISSKSAGLLYLVDSFEGSVVSVLQGEHCCAVYSADNSFIVAGCPDGTLDVWERAADNRFVPGMTVDEAHLRSVSAVACSSKLDVVATGCTSVALWIKN